ncbi:MAG: NYN domain-containing protein [Gemmatimonadetes bacterium]|nr:NYN domain-containing protein [Gemmatimonadota bacterium]
MAPVAASGAYTHAANAALLIDFDNVTLGIQKDLGKELRSLLSSDVIKGKVAVQRAYADWRRYPQYVVSLAESSIDPIMAVAYGSAKKNATDIRLAIDAVELVFTRPEIGTFILLSGDSDFSSLVMKLKEYGKYVIGVGIRESASDLLVQNCDEYYSYNALAGLTRTADDEISHRDPWQLVSEAIERMKRNGDVMRSDRLKQVMQELDAGFDEKNLGYSKFSRFCMEAASKGLLVVNKLENGQLEVAPPGDAPAAAASSREPRTEGAEGEERGGRGRRGRRGGRGRRGERPAAGEGAAETPETVLAIVPDEAPHAISQPIKLHDAGGPEVGLDGERLSRVEAFDLVRRAVAQLITGDDVVRAGAVRRKAHELLGRDSESLSERNFPRILKDAHEAEIIDLRRRGDDWEIGLAQAASVADQLTAAATAHAPPKLAAPPPPRGMGPRGAPASGRSRGPARGTLPPVDLFAYGVVEDHTPVPAGNGSRPGEGDGVDGSATDATTVKPRRKPAAKKKLADDGEKPKAKRASRARKAVAE